MYFSRKMTPVWTILLILVIGFFLVPNASANMLYNSSFETVGPLGTSTSFTGLYNGGTTQYSAAQDWWVWNNTAGTTTTELVPSTLSGGGSSMIHVTTTGGSNGLYQTFLPVNTGPTHVIGSAWIYVISGIVGIGTGNDGNTHADIVTSTIGQWVFLQAPNGVSPANEFIIYSNGGPAEFYAENASVNSVPEPAAILLLGVGIFGLAALRKKGEI